jgi:hypothetical protein
LERKKGTGGPRPQNSRGGGALAEFAYDFCLRSAMISLAAASSVSVSKPSLARNSSNDSLPSIDALHFLHARIRNEPLVNNETRRQ